tara:strand:- start:1041 stop:2294 length:1254 start_codon:yes stop_codon:yes gene_type:complete
MIKWAKDLFPLCRSLIGEGNRKTIKYFKKINPEFKILKFKSGSKVFDWEIPNEWIIQDSYLQHESGKRFAEFKKSNLHVVNYSQPINKTFEKEKILSKIFTEKSMPDAIPYVTSYYNKDWGFCLSENEKNGLPQGKYKAYINSRFEKSYLEIAEAVIKGKSKKEILFSSYICHPSMANNELSGPVLLNAILLYLKNNFKNLKYTYRFVLLPETIGSIAYISKRLKLLKENIISGYVLTCVGDERCYSMVKTPNENTLADFSLSSALIGIDKVKKYSFLHRGSDERQYCAPGVDLPVSSFLRSKTYPEYHTSKDDFSLVTEKGLNDSFQVMKNIIDTFETGLYPKFKNFCEPQLGKRNLYTVKFSKKNTYAEELYIRKNLLAYSDGKRSIFEISNILQVPLRHLLEQYKILKKSNVIN